MTPESKQERAGAAIRRINQLWVSGQVEALTTLLHPEIVMAFPGFTGRIQGREQFLGGFHDFCDNARILEFRDYDYQIDAAGDTAVVTFLYEMIYERSGARYHATGRDLWIFRSQESAWIAVWRTMLEMNEEPV